MEALSSNLVLCAHTPLERTLSNLLDQLSKNTPARDRLVREHNITDVESTCEKIRQVLSTTIILGCY